MKEHLKNLIIRLVFLGIVCGILWVYMFAPWAQEETAEEQSKAETIIPPTRSAGITGVLENELENALSNVTIKQLETTPSMSGREEAAEVLEVDNSEEASVVSGSGVNEVQKETVTKAALETKVKRIDKDVDKNKYVNASVLNVRNHPTTDSKVTAKVVFGDKLHLVKAVKYRKDGETTEMWYQVKDGKLHGFVHADYLQNEPPMICLGDYLITYYCSCAICCDVETGITASGAHVQEGVTVAADPSIPFGTKLMIDGHLYTVQDRGGMIKGKHIDIYVEGHHRALTEFYVHHTPVYMVP